MIGISDSSVDFITVQMRKANGLLLFVKDFRCTGAGSDGGGAFCAFRPTNLRLVRLQVRVQQSCGRVLGRFADTAQCG